MKKIFLLILICAFLTGNAFAVTLDIAANNSTGGLQLVGYVASSATGAQTKVAQMSNNVYMTAEYNTNGYCLSTYHSQGTKAYGTGYDSTSIFWEGVGENALTTGNFAPPTSSAADEAFPTDGGWTAM